MSEWSSPFLSRTLLRSLSALLTICLLAQFFIAGIAVMTDRRACTPWMPDCCC